MKIESPAALRASALLALPVVVIALLFLALHRSQDWQPAFPKARVELTGSMQHGGELPGEKFPANASLRNWGSWSGSDDNFGELRFGPFRAPKMIRFAAGGFPQSKGVRIFLKRADDGAEEPIFLAEIRETWRLQQHMVPPAWRGQPVYLCAVDSATGPGGWLSISEPIKGNRFTDSTELLQSLTCWTLNAFLLGCLFFAAAVFLARRNVPEEWLPLLAAALVALAGYVLFWIYFVNNRAGEIASLLALIAGVIGAWRFFYNRPRQVSFCLTSSLIFVISFFYLALLYLYWSPLDFNALAANRFREDLPADNYLPYLVAKMLWRGESLRAPLGSWLVSDRPPLQTGWILFTYPFAQIFHLDERALSGSAALLLQCVWIAAVYGLLRALRISAFRAALWIAVIALSGFFLQNTTFAWPKLAAGAFACGAFAFWFLPIEMQSDKVRFAVGGCLAALGWLAHGGVAFCFIPLGFVALFQIWRGQWKRWLYAAAVFVAVVAPWICFQKIYNPPGNRLLKWHLAGQVEVDARGTVETLRDSYGSQSPSALLAAKWLNFKTQFAGDWTSLFRFDPAGASERRHDEFFYTARAMTWWWLWILFFPFVVLRKSREGFSFNPHLRLAAWTVATLIVWSLLIFIGGQAIIHQGPYTIELVAFALFSALLEATSKWAVVVIGVLQSATLITTYFVSNATVHGKMIGLPVLVVALLVGTLVLIRTPRISAAGEI